MHSHLDASQAMGLVAFRRVASEVHSAAKRTSFYIAFGRDFCGFRIDFGRFWEAKWKAKSIFWRFLFDVFLECVLASIWGGFLEARNLKNQ